MRAKIPKNKQSWQPEGFLFNSYFTEVYRRALLLSLDCSTLPLIYTLYCWLLSKEVSSTIFKVFGMMSPGIEPRFPGPLVNTLPTCPMSRFEPKIVLSSKSILNMFFSKNLAATCFCWVIVTHMHIYRALQEKQGQTHKWQSTHGYINIGWPAKTFTNLSAL